MSLLPLPKPGEWFGREPETPPSKEFAESHLKLYIHHVNYYSFVDGEYVLKSSVRIDRVEK